jgi:hypothetical protein
VLNESGESIAGGAHARVRPATIVIAVVSNGAGRR